MCGKEPIVIKQVNVYCDRPCTGFKNLIGWILNTFLIHAMILVLLLEKFR